MLIKNTKYCKYDTDQAENDVDPIKIASIKEELRLKLTSIASKLLSCQDFNFYHLSEEEQNLWSKFDKSEIYKFITGEKDTLPEFQYNWIEPCQLAAHLSPELLRTLHDLKPPVDQNKVPAPPPPAPPVQQHIQAAPQHAPVHPPPPAPAPQPLPGPSGLQVNANPHCLRDRKKIDYKELHTGVKQRCPKLRRKAKAAITRLAPGAFSPKNSLPGQSSQNKETPGLSCLPAPFYGPASYNFLLHLKRRNLSLLTPSSPNQTNFNFASDLWETTRPQLSSAMSESHLTIQLFCNSNRE
jgi:hypothetical protein